LLSAVLSTPRLRGVFILLTALLFGGCATATYQVKVDAVAAPSTAPRKSYRLEHATLSDNQQSLYTAAGKAVRAALAHKGLVEVTGAAEPDLLILFSCGLGAPLKQLSAHSEPVYQMIPGPMRTETVQVGVTSTGSPIFQTVTRQDPPTQIIAGYRDVSYEVVLYKKYLRLRAFEHRRPVAAGERTGAWAIDAIAEGEDKNVVGALPLLAAAGMIYLDKTSNGPVTVRLTDADADVRAIRSAR
jgi:hypothetical protein